MKNGFNNSSTPVLNYGQRGNQNLEDPGDYPRMNSASQTRGFEVDHPIWIQEKKYAEDTPYIHWPNQHRDDMASQRPVWVRKCWIPIKIFLLLFLIPFLLVWKQLKAIYEVFRYAYLIIVNQEKFTEKIFSWFQRNRTKKTMRAALSMSKETSGFNMELEKVEKRTFRRPQPTPEYLAIENLVLFFASRGATTEEVFIKCKQLIEKDNVDLRRKVVKMGKNNLCRVPFMPESNCNVKRSDFRIESYWIIWPGVPDDAPVVLYLHGGAFVVGNTLLMGYLSYLSKLSHLSKCRVLSVNYRLCPQYTIHDSVDDCEGAFDWLIENQGLKPSRIAIAGESAGGGLCLILMQRLNSKHKPLPKCAHLISPFVGLLSDEEANDVAGRYAGVCLFTHQPLINLVSRILSGVIGPDLIFSRSITEVDLESPEINPIKGDFQGFPPIQIMCSNWESLHDLICEFARKVEEAGVKVDLVVKEGLLHAWPLICAGCLETDMAITLAAQFINDHIPL